MMRPNSGRWAGAFFIASGIGAFAGFQLMSAVGLSANSSNPFLGALLLAMPISLLWAPLALVYASVAFPYVALALAAFGFPVTWLLRGVGRSRGVGFVAIAWGAIAGSLFWSLVQMEPSDGGRVVLNAYGAAFGVPTGVA